MRKKAIEIRKTEQLERIEQKLEQLLEILGGEKNIVAEAQKRSKKATKAEDKAPDA